MIENIARLAGVLGAPEINRLNRLGSRIILKIKSFVANSPKPKNIVSNHLLILAKILESKNIQIHHLCQATILDRLSIESPKA